MTIKALMVDVDGVLVDGRPEDGRPWQASLEEDFGFSASALREHFFAPHWEDIVVGRAALMDRLTPALKKIAPQVAPNDFVAYWFRQDSRLVLPVLQALSAIRAKGTLIYLATNQEHMRADYLMRNLGLSSYVDGICYSAQMSVKKPDARFFGEAGAATGLRAPELLLVDDGLENVEAARRAGWKAVYWKRGSSPGEIRAAIEPEC